jgi:hypothetical protein
MPTFDANTSPRSCHASPAAIRFFACRRRVSRKTSTQSRLLSAAKTSALQTSPFSVVEQNLLA